MYTGEEEEIVFDDNGHQCMCELEDLDTFQVQGGRSYMAKKNKEK